jgi:tRNA threonylcarbamoyl adenosine modification protein (Sua5/YciO/YrdC/YwlC family)
MIILDYTPKKHKEIIAACVHAFREGKVIAYPTDTSYGLGCDITNKKAVLKFYRIKERGFNKPVHVVVPSMAYAKSVSEWNGTATKLVKNFWPGALSIILPRKQHNMELVNKSLKRFGAGTGTVGLRMPDNRIALDLASSLGEPIPATSANPGGGYDCYKVSDIVEQFKNKKYKPDIIINAGRLPKKKPSTLVKIIENGVEILRQGPVNKKQILNAVK